MRDAFGAMFTDDDFAALFPRRGQPAEAPWRLALVLVMQYVEDLSDRQAADAVRSRIDWKYALSLELTDPGFDSTVLSEFRTRLVMGAEFALPSLQVSSTRGSQLGGVSVPTRRMYWRMSAPSTAWSVLGKPSAMRSTIWPRSPRSGSRAIVCRRGERGRRLDDTRLPTSQEDRHAYAQEIGVDGYALLTALYAPKPLAGYVKSPPSRRYDGCGCSNSIERMAACAGAQSTKGSRPLGFLSVPL